MPQIRIGAVINSRLSRKSSGAANTAWQNQSRHEGWRLPANAALKVIISILRSLSCNDYVFMPQVVYLVFEVPGILGLAVFFKLTGYI